ncbi:hypothetical protein [Candidatus Entotheonella palauensis]|uniref:hypothetical protein n=1 Tax=Candidatus Entotheonella palauensis TaxID=93172 RepID=UPI0015C49BFD|nr:hypothetical protein [Candidatus Entotheonella palauensis]
MIFPEIPVSYDDPNLDQDNFEDLVRGYVDDLVDLGLITSSQKSNFINGMKEAFEEAHQ